MKNLLCILLMSLAVACNTAEEKVDPTKIFDPKVPGGSAGGQTIVQNVLNLTASTEYDQVELKWKNPSVYDGLSFKIHVYRIDGDGEAFTLPDPSNIANGAFLYYPRPDFQPFTGSLYLDKNASELTGSLFSGNQYTYYVYVEKNSVFSSGKKITITVPEKSSQVTIPSPTNFWKNYVERTGAKPDPDYGTISMQTLDAGAPTLTSANGGIAYALNGTIQYLADTKNNRVMIYMNTLGKACYDDFTPGSFDFDLCLAIYGNAPLTPYAVLGQKNFSENFSCQDAGRTLALKDCLTAPTQIVVNGSQIAISDTGNKRVKIYDTTPIYGCYSFMDMIGETTPNHCSPSRVIGQRNLNELNTYSVATDGDVSLGCPNGLAAHNNNLYIADTCNHRVVLARNAFTPSLFDCTITNWKTSKCVFGGIIGQETLFENKTFVDEWNDGNFSYDYALNTLVGDTDFLKRYVAYPKLIKLTSSNQLFVTGSENFSEVSPFGSLELHGRVLRFNTLILEGTFPTCSQATFLIGGCNADWIYGQQGSKALPVTSLGGTYMDTFYTLKNIGGIEFYAERMFVTDAESNIVSVWNNYMDNTVLGSPASMRVFNPLGVWDADRERSQPNLKGLSSIVFNKTKNGLIIFDSGSNYYYLIQIYNPF